MNTREPNMIIIGEEKQVDYANYCLWAGTIIKIFDSRETVDGRTKALFMVRRPTTTADMMCGFIDDNAVLFHQEADLGDFITMQGTLFQEKYMKDGNRKTTWILRVDYAKLIKK